jgi:Na+/melibiose symporter-like transporter
VQPVQCYNFGMTILLWICLILLGWVVGAIVNYFSDVLPWRRKLVSPFCLNCSATIPLHNYFLWPRKCEACGTRRTLRAWVVELTFVILSLALWYNHPVKLGFWLGGLVLAFFALVVIIDIEHRLILHPVSIFGLVWVCWWVLTCTDL